MNGKKTAMPNTHAQCRWQDNFIFKEGLRQSCVTNQEQCDRASSDQIFLRLLSKNNSTMRPLLPKQRFDLQYKKILIVVVMSYLDGFLTLHSTVIINCVIILNAPRI